MQADGKILATRGTSYLFLDRRAPRKGRVSYALEDVRGDGSRVVYGLIASTR